MILGLYGIETSRSWDHFSATSTFFHSFITSNKPLYIHIYIYMQNCWMLCIILISFLKMRSLIHPCMYVCILFEHSFSLSGTVTVDLFFFFFFVLELWIQWKRLTRRALHNFNQCSALSVTEVSSNQTMPFMNPWVGLGWGTIGICKGRSCWWFAFNCKYGTMAI